MDELSKTKLARPMDRQAMGNDLATLRALCGELNNPLVTGAEPPKAEESAPIAMPTPAPALQMPAPPAPAKIIPEAERRPVTSIVSKQIFFTGASKAGKSWLAAQLGARTLELDDPIQAMAKSAFGDYRPESYPAFAEEVFAWGEGMVTKQYPLTAARSQFVESIRDIPHKKGSVSFEEFGTAGFWARTLIVRVQMFHKEFPKELVVVTDVGTADQYVTLKEYGFTPFHVTCNNTTRKGRGGNDVVPALVKSIESSITQKISQSPKGQKLWCVWCDDKYPVPHARLLSVQEFLQGVK